MSPTTQQTNEWLRTLSNERVAREVRQIAAEAIDDITPILGLLLIEAARRLEERS
jgi:hypothetical protein